MGNIGGGGSDRGIIIETGDKTIQAINNLNESTTGLNKIVVWLTVVLVLLTGALVWLTVILIRRRWPCPRKEQTTNYLKRRGE